jgi:DNA-binding NarL/FixJ family response regulator
MYILLYDDHNFVTGAISAYIKEQIQGCCTLRCHTIEEAIHSLSMNEVNLVISDVLSDEDAGFTIFELLAKKYPHTKVVAYTSITNPFIIQSLSDLGVSAVVNKKESIENLWQIVRKIVLDTKVKSKNVTPVIYLTKREKEIADLLTKGLSAKEIADKLGSSQNTINNQKNAMLEKFDCVNSTELIVKLTQMGLIGIL